MVSVGLSVSSSPHVRGRQQLLSPAGGQNLISIPAGRRERRGPGHGSPPDLCLYVINQSRTSAREMDTLLKGSGKGRIVRILYNLCMISATCLAKPGLAI